MSISSSWYSWPDTRSVLVNANNTQTHRHNYTETDTVMQWLHGKQIISKQDTLCWYSQRRSWTPHFWGAHPGGYDPQIRTRPRFLYNASTPSPMFTRSVAILLTNKQTYTPTNKQMPLKTPNVLRYATTLGNYFSLRQRPSEIVLFQSVETCPKLFQNYFTSLLQLTNIFQHVQRRWNNYEIISELFRQLK